MDGDIFQFTEHIIRPCSQIESAKELESQVKGSVIILDSIERQLIELFKTQNAGLDPMSSEYKVFLAAFLNEKRESNYGNWLYLPWQNSWVKILEEQEYLEVLTSRNKQKINAEEQQRLRTKTILIIGLSVGQTAAVCLAMENIGKVIRLADFDTLDLSNLNRLRGGIHEVGERKTSLAARRIIEVNPYAEIEIVEEGASAQNLPQLLNGVDVLLEECDSLPIKILSRLYARDLGIPVVMDTSDRGMLDVERFDLQQDRPLFHGLAGDLNLSVLQSLSKEEGMKIMMALVDFPNISDRLKESYALMGKTLTSWPQLASEVTSGGAHAVEAVRRILLGHPMESGRYFLEIDKPKYS